MEPQNSKTSDYVRFLLGQLPDEDVPRVESSLIDDESYEQFLLAERSLIDSYLTGQLDARERQLFEDNYLTDSPDRLEKVAKGSVILSVLPEFSHLAATTASRRKSWSETLRTSIRKPMVALSYALAAFVIVSLATLAFIRNRTANRLSEQSAQTLGQLKETNRQIEKRDEEIRSLNETLRRLERERDELMKREMELRAQIEGKTENQTLIAVLSPFATKGPGDDRTYPVRPNTELVRLGLKLREGLPDQKYRVSVNGKVIKENLTASRSSQGRVVWVSLSPRQLIHGTNTIELFSRDESQDYRPIDGYSIAVSKQ